MSNRFLAQSYGVEVVTVNEDIGVLTGALGAVDLTGYSTYQVFITMENEDDFLSAISGDDDNPTYITTTTLFYHSVLGGATPNGITSLLFPVYPELEFDSWVTIGLSGSPNATIGEANVSTVQSSINPWTSNFDSGTGLLGGNIVIDDAVGGAWYALNGDANGVAGSDLKVLAGQFTTDGDLAVQLYTQIFINGYASNPVVSDITYNPWTGESIDILPTFYWPTELGCTDDMACNYEAMADEDDGSCTYPLADYVDCDGNCLNDMDADGVCDEDEVPGCTDMMALNFNDLATDDDGSCAYPANQGYGIEVEVVSEDIGMLVSVLGNYDLSGYSCYRVYITMENEDDFLSSISGDANNPTYINTTTDFYNAVLGGVTPNGINSLLFPVYPDLAYDSWVTIGLDGAPNTSEGEAEISTFASDQNPWTTNFDPGPGAGLPGGNIALDDVVGGAWYALNGDANGVAGADLKVLAGQFTTTGALSVQMFTQIFINGDGQNEYLPDGVNRPTFIWPVTAVEGCTDVTACNFHPEATEDDGSCTYPEPLQDCDGNCLAFMASSPGNSEGYGLEVEVVASDIGPLVGALGVTDLTGYNCTRLHVTMNNEDDFMSSVSGDAINPTYVNTTTSFYHAALGAGVPNGINSLLFPVYPDLAYDSWVTIGLEGTPNALIGEANVSSVQSSINPWMTTFDPGGGFPGGNIAIDDLIGGAWYALNGDANGVAGEDLKVLIGQFTTTGELSGQVYCQVFINGNGQTDFFDTFYFDNSNLALGCLDESACNFNACAMTDDGSCEYPAVSFLDCNGECLNDADNDGVCDEEEPCSDPLACDYGGGFPDQAPYCLRVDTVTVHEEGELAGMTTYRLWFSCDSPDDFVSAVAGYNDHPTRIQTTTSFYQNELGGVTPNGILPVLYTISPELEFDSWVSIGLEQAPQTNSGEAAVNVIESDDTPWISEFDPGFGAVGSDIIMDGAAGGSWFALYGDANAYAGDDKEVLLGQFTTDGILSGELYIQVFEGGFGSPSLFLTRTIGESCYVPDEDCTYALDVYGVEYVDCDGNCLHDADGDGVCDEEEIPGCTDIMACNYNEAASDDDGSCSFLNLVSVNTSPLTCPENEDGAIEVEVGMGVPPFLLSVSGFDVTESNSDTIQYFGLAEGLYTVQVEDDAGCVTEVAPFLIDAPDTLSVAAITFDVCATPGGQEVMVDIEGGTPPYSVFIPQLDTTLDTSGDVWIQLGPGLWDVEVTDVFNCPSALASIDIEPCLGCTDEAACNFDTTAYADDGSCTYPLEVYLDCEGVCLNDVDGDGVCDEEEVPGCTWPVACNYDPQATDEDGSCFLASVFFDCEGNCTLDLNDNGFCDFYENLNDGSGFCGEGTVWDSELGECIGVDECPSDVDGNGYVGINDLLDLLADFTTYCD